MQYLWEILWLWAIHFSVFANVFALSFHQGECDARKLSGEDHQCLGRRFAVTPMLLVKALPR
ncbi:hypothetical protein PS652_04719 [Pseudomonas fluorescens]|uniref:Uncharacterized protein n=1 Tax=Pseudomonas fluorescens TaxID=294 RepID=A0A5E6SAI4_PSEFL|nr:hypothetical protein PS652_02134 [Pseudomonas fluorescens]